MKPALQWSDLNVVLALGRDGALAPAARRLGVDQTTVSRRLSAIEAALEGPLFLRERGRLVPTALGEEAIARAAEMETAVQALETAASESGDAVAGSVRVTAVPLLVNQLLVPHLPALLDRHPALEIEAIAESRNLSLSRRETDIALRLARPQQGVTGLCRKIGELAFSVYAARDADPARLSWVTYEDRFRHYPQARWVDSHVKAEDLAPLRINDAEGLAQAVRSGLGLGLLPDFMGLRDPALQQISESPVLQRDLWLLVHADLRHLPRIAAVMDWLAELPAAISAESAQ